VELVAVRLVVMGMRVPALLALRDLGRESGLGNDGRPPGVVVLTTLRGVGPFGSPLPRSSRDGALVVVEVEPVAVEEQRAWAEPPCERVVEVNQLLEPQPMQRRGRDRGVVRTRRRQTAHPVSTKVGIDKFQLTPFTQGAAADGEKDGVR